MAKLSQRGQNAGTSRRRAEGRHAGQRAWNAVGKTNEEGIDYEQRNADESPQFRYGRFCAGDRRRGFRLGGMFSCAAYGSFEGEPRSLGGPGFRRRCGSPRLRRACVVGAAPSISDADCVETVDVEVLVIGAGCSGMVAANFAAMEGAKTLLIEKFEQGTGLRGSAIGAVGSRKQKEAGVNIDPLEESATTWCITR